MWRGQCKAPEGWPFFESLNMSWAEGPQRIAVVRLREGRLAWQVTWVAASPPLPFSPLGLILARPTIMVSTATSILDNPMSARDQPRCLDGAFVGVFSASWKTSFYRTTKLAM